MDDTPDRRETGAERRVSPVEDRIPMARLARYQALRRRGAVADEIGAKIFDNLTRHFVPRGGNAVDDGVGEPRHWHSGRVDELGLGVPLRSDCLRKRPARRRQHAARRRLYRTPIERDREARRVVTHLDLFVETALESAHIAPRRLRRVDRLQPLQGKNLFEHVAHAVISASDDLAHHGLLWRSSIYKRTAAPAHG